MEYRPWDESIRSRASYDTARFLGKLWGRILPLVIGTVLAVAVGLSPYVTPDQRIWVGALTGLISFLTTLLLVYLFNLLMTPYRQRSEARGEIAATRAKIPSFSFRLLPRDVQTLAYGNQLSYWYRIEVMNDSVVIGQHCRIDVFDIEPQVPSFTRRPLEVSNEGADETNIAPNVPKSFALFFFVPRLIKGFICSKPNLELPMEQEYVVRLRFTADQFSVEGVYKILCHRKESTVEEINPLGALES